MTYQGYSNRTTWNCSLWLTNDYGYYKFTLGLVNSKVTDWVDIAPLLTKVFGSSTTPDGCAWEQANREEMNEVLADLID